MTDSKIHTSRTIISGQQINEKAEAALEKATPKKDRKFPVVEIFGPTIQGEGAMLGTQTMFIRFGGCDFRCTKCDSLHAVLPEEVKKNSVRMTANEIVAAMQPSMERPQKTRWITLSGGNPVMHDLGDLIDNLHDDDRAIAVETQGSLWADWLLKCDHVTISPKGPGMGEEFSAEDFQVYMTKLNSRIIHRLYSVKVVIMSQVDIEFAKMLLSTWPAIRDFMYLSLGNPFPPQVNDGKGLSPQEIRGPLLDHYVQLVEDILQEPFLHDCKVTPQLHVLFWGNERNR